MTIEWFLHDYLHDVSTVFATMYARGVRTGDTTYALGTSPAKPAVPERP